MPLLTERFRRRIWRYESKIRYSFKANPWRRWAVYSVGILCGLGIVWIAITGYFARADAQQIRTRLHQVQQLVRAGDIKTAEKVAAKIPALAHRAHRLTTGPAWFLASEVPYIGTPLDIARGTTAATDELGTHGINVLLDVASQIDPEKLRTTGHSVNLAPLAAASGKLKIVSVAVHRAIKILDSTPNSSWFASVDAVHASMQGLLGSVAGYVDAASRASQVLPSMLGDDGPKRYFVGLQNEAEMRGTGGLPGSFAIMTADHGRVSFDHFESDQALTPHSTGSRVQTGLSFGQSYDDAYGASDPTQIFVNSNVSPNFPYAAQIWAAMWEKTTGEHIDGAIALHPGVLANLLQATGPIKTTEGITLNSQNVVSFTEQQEYAIFNNNTARRNFLVGVLKKVSTDAISGRASAASLVSAISLSAKQHRALVWTSDAADEKIIEETDYSGVIPQTNQAFIGLVMTNAAAGKLDYYLQRNVDYQSTGCGKTHDVLVSITLQNTAPPSGLPTYVTDRLDKNPPKNVKPGDNRSIVDYWATAGAQLESITINGAKAGAVVLDELGHRVFRIDQELPQGSTTTIVLHLAEPANADAPQVWYQPGVNAESVNVDTQNCH